jgi:hypothetical protein
MPVVAVEWDQLGKAGIADRLGGHGVLEQVVGDELSRAEQEFSKLESCVLDCEFCSGYLGREFDHECWSSKEGCMLVSTNHSTKVAVLKAMASDSWVIRLAEGMIDRSGQGVIEC